MFKPTVVTTRPQSVKVLGGVLADCDDIMYNYIQYLTAYLFV